jgi:hypothetical protein
MRESRGPYSAFCAACQPIYTGPALTGKTYQCAACDRLFTSPSAFDQHQRYDTASGTSCLDPATAGIVPKQRADGWQLWGWPQRGNPPHWGERQTGPKRGGSSP